MGRPREFNEDKALKQAMDLFWRKGYEATSLQDLLEVMGLSKSSFYQTFANKHKLLERSIDHYRQMIVEDLSRNLATAGSGLQFIREMLSGVAEKVDQSGGRQGCLVMNCASEFAQRDPVIARLVAESIAQFRQVFLSGVRQAQHEGDIPMSKDAEVLAHYLVGCKSGLEAMAKAGTPQKDMQDVIQVMLSALN